MIILITKLISVHYYQITKRIFILTVNDPNWLWGVEKLGTLLQQQNSGGKFHF